MEDFKLCSDGEFLPASIPCPPPYSGPYYYYPYENIPLPPEQGSTDVYSPSPEGTPISSGAVAGIIIVVGFVFFVMCLVALKCRSRFIVGNIVRVSSRNARNGELIGGEVGVQSGDMLVNIVGCGLEQKLVNLLPVCEYVGLMQEGKMDGKERQECAVCLSLFEEKEMVRVLPKCRHIFHIHCIDKWFESHANCPLCRERITLQTIQLSFNSEKLNNPQPLDSRPLPHDSASTDDIAHQAPISDLHADSPVLSDACGRLEDLSHHHQNIFLAAASAACINTPGHTAEDADCHARHQVGGHRAADNDREGTGIPCGIAAHRNHHSLSLPAGTAKPVQQAAHDEVNREVENASTQAARDECALYIGDGQYAGSLHSQLQSLYEQPHNQSAATNDQSQYGVAASNWTAAAVNDESRSAPAASDRAAGQCNGELSKRLVQQGADAGSDSSDDHRNALASPSPSKIFDKSLHNPQQLMQGSMISNAHVAARYNRGGGQLSSLRKSLSTGSLMRVGVRDPIHTIPSSFSW